jgi:hypothetical protein
MLEIDSPCLYSVYDPSTDRYFCKIEKDGIYLRLCCYEFEETLEECKGQKEKDNGIL